MLKALIFDVDGTLADTESVHRAAFNQAFADSGLDWLWDEETYCRLLQISGGKERILHYWREVQPGLVELTAGTVLDTVEQIHGLKTSAYERLAQDGALCLRPGVMNLLTAAHNAGLMLAIATTTSPQNVGALLRRTMGAEWRQYFQAIEDASTAPNKKPHPQAYLQAMSRLQLQAPECMAFEDSFNGLSAASAAGLKTVVTPTRFTEGQDFSLALRCLPDLAGISVSDLLEWQQLPA